MAKPVYIVDVCGTLFHDDTTVGLLSHHFATCDRNRGRLLLLRAVTAQRSPIRLMLTVLEYLSGRHILKHMLVRLLKGDSIESLQDSAKSYAGLLLGHRRVDRVWAQLEQRPAECRLVLASASLEPIVAALANRMNVDYVASSLEDNGGRLSGRFRQDLTGRKEVALRQLLGPNWLGDGAIVISDNFTDNGLMELAVKAYAVVHKPLHRKRWAGTNVEFIKA